jgi:hypothetical protein
MRRLLGLGLILVVAALSAPTVAVGPASAQTADPVADPARTIRRWQPRLRTGGLGSAEEGCEDRRGGIEADVADIYQLPTG